MEKIKETIKKHDNMLVIFIIILLTIGICFNIPIKNNDELWNYQNICKILNGYKIYTDANVITTPIFHFIGYVILKILGNNLLIFRIYNLLITIIFYFLIYKIIKELCNNKFRAFTYFLIIILTTMGICGGGANYNMLAMAFVLFGIYLNLKWLKNKEKHNIIQATIMFIVVFTKQNIGVYYIIGILIYQLIIYKNLKNIIKQILIFLVETAILIIIFFQTGILYDFINYVILGIGEFGTKNIGGNIINLIESLSFIIISIIAIKIILQNKKIKFEEKNKIILITSFAIIMQLISYPIYNDYHKIIANIILYIEILYLLDFVILKDFIIEEKIKKIFEKIIIIIISCYIIMSMKNFINWIDKAIYCSKFNYTHPYFGGYFQNDEEYEKMQKIIDYIKNQDKKVVIFSEEAALYMIPLKQSNGAMDLPFLGNLGKDGEENMIKEISNMSNILFLVKSNQEELHYQESTKINQYIYENMECIGTIEEFSIYEK